MDRTLPELNFPAYDFKIRGSGTKLEIFDSLRKKFVALTDEEWVRQHCIQFLIEARNYPKGLVRIESAHRSYHNTQRRTDIVVYSRHGKPFMLVECKSPRHAIDQKVLFQATNYNSILQCGYILLTNGLKHYCCIMDGKKQGQFLDQIPEYPEAAD